MPTDRPKRRARGSRASPAAPPPADADPLDTMLAAATTRTDLSPALRGWLLELKDGERASGVIAPKTAPSQGGPS